MGALGIDVDDCFEGEGEGEEGEDEDEELLRWDTVAMTELDDDDDDDDDDDEGEEEVEDAAKLAWFGCKSIKRLWVKKEWLT